MSDIEAAKRTSNYHSPLRAKQAAETRRAVIDAALLLFSARGWTATTLPLIATEAGVAEDTIYKTFGTKSALLMAVLEIALVGDHDETAFVDRADYAEVTTGRLPQRLRKSVRYALTAYARSVPILETLREAAASDETARARLTRYDDERHDLMAEGVARILGHEPTPEVVDAVFALLSPEVYAHLVTGQGWSPTQAEDWLVDLLQAALEPRHH